MLEEITDYYIPSKDNELLIKTANTVAKGRPRSLKPSWETILENIMPVGFNDTWRCSAKYKELFSNLMIMAQSNSDIYEAITKNGHEDNHNSQMQASQKDVPCIPPKIKNEQLRDIVFYRIIEKWFIKSICAKLEVSPANIRDTINYLK